MNFGKSRLFGTNNIPKDKQNSQYGNLGVQVDDGKGIYLEMPYMVGMPKNEVFSFLNDRIWHKLNRLHRERGIKLVIQAMPTYIMSRFQLTKRLYKDVRLLIRNFWWDGNGKEREVCLQRWEILCDRKAGSMGFNDMPPFNLALLAKQGWRLIKYLNH